MEGPGKMNRRTFLSLPLLGFFSTVTEPVYGDMFQPGTVTHTSWTTVEAGREVWHNGERYYITGKYRFADGTESWPGCEVIEGKDGE
jgi:hypothetical protein